MAFEIWLTTAALYLVMTIALSLVVAWLERRCKVH
jgi:polar amino acid transport system permease protein